MAEPPHLGRLQPGPALGAVLYTLLVISLAVALLGDRTPLLPQPWTAAAPVAFALFLALFATYRFVLIRAGRYPFGRALYQVGAGLLFLAVLLHRGPIGAPARSDALPALLQNADPLVRRLGCELARYRPEGAAALPLVRDHAAHDQPWVSEACQASLKAMSPR